MSAIQLCESIVNTGSCENRRRFAYISVLSQLSSTATGGHHWVEWSDVEVCVFFNKGRACGCRGLG